MQFHDSFIFYVGFVDWNNVVSSVELSGVYLKIINLVSSSSLSHDKILFNLPQNWN